MEKVIQFSARVASVLNQKEGRTAYSIWRTWRDLVESMYELQLGKTTVITTINEGRQEAKKCRNIQDAFTGFSSLSDTEQDNVLQLLRMYITVLSKSDVYHSHDQCDELWTRIIKLSGISADRSARVVGLNNNNKDNIDRQKFGTVIEIPATIRVVLFDVLLRWILLWYALSDFGPKNFMGIGSIGFIVVSQVIIIPSFIIAFAFFRNKLVVARTVKLLEELKISNLKLRISNSSWNYLYLVLILLVGGTATASLDMAGDGRLPVLGIIILGSLYTVYVLILQFQFSKRVPTVQSVKNQLQEIRQQELDGSLGVDENDEEIVNLEVALRSAQGKVESFVIEAALLGALAFTCFLQIIATSDFSVNSITEFNHHFHGYIANQVNLVDTSVGLSAYFASKSSVLSIMCYESILCSVFFLSVIASRLRLGYLSDAVARSIELAKTYNRKEEENMFSENPEMQIRVQKYNIKIKDELRNGYRIQAKIKPILEFMGFFRTLGVLAFFAIVITGGTFLSIEVAMVLCAVSMLSFVYFRLQYFINGWKNFKSRLQEYYFPRHRKVSITLWSAFAGIVLIRSLANIPFVNDLLFLDLLLLVVHYILKTFLPGELAGGKEGVNYGVSFTRLMKVILHLAVALSIVSAIYKLCHWAGAGPFLILSNFILAFFFLFSPKIIQGKRWMGYIMSFALSVASLALVFSIMRWPGSTEMQRIATIGIITGIAITIYRWKDISGFNKRAVAVYTYLVLGFYFPFLTFAMAEFRFDYAKYQSSLDFNRTTWIIYEQYGELKSPADCDSMIYYVDKLNREHPDRMNWDEWDSFARQLYTQTEDSVYLAQAICWCDSAIASEPYADCYFTKAQIQYKLGDLEGALDNCRSALDGGVASVIRELMFEIYTVRDSLRSIPTADTAIHEQDSLVYR